MKKLIFIVILMLFYCPNAFAAISEDADCVGGVCELSAVGGTQECTAEDTPYDCCTGADAGCTGDYRTWKGFWNDLTTLTADITLLVEPHVFVETVYPGQVTEDLNGFTIHVKPTETYYYPTSSDITTGPRFDLQYTTSDEFLNLNAADTGHIIIEGLSIYSTTAGKTAPAAFFLISSVGTYTTTLRRLSIKGDGTTNAQYGIQENTAAVSPLKVYNNFIYDVYAGIYLSTALAAGSYIINNTIYGCEGAGIDFNGLAAIANNNYVYDTVAASSDFLDPDGAIGYNNGCTDASCADAEWSTGAGNQDSKTFASFTLTSWANDEYFLNASAVTQVNLGVGDHSSTDDDLVAYYKFEDGALKVDSSTNSNALTDDLDGAPSRYVASVIVEDSCAYFEDDESYYRTYANLTTDFPGKNGNKDLTACMWYMPGGDSDGDTAGLVGIYAGNVGEIIWLVWKDTNDNIAFKKGYNDGASEEEIKETGIALLCDWAHWYHVCVSYDDYGSDSANTGDTKIQVYDLTANITYTEDDSTMDYTMDIHVDDTPLFQINNLLWDGTDYEEAGLIDDLRIYNTALSFAEMDDIRHLRFYGDACNRSRIGNYDIGADEYIVDDIYYMSDSGSDDATGQDTSHPWLTLAHATASTDRGDTISLNKADTWTGVTFYIPYPGMTINAYGEGADPIIDCNDAVDNGIWAGYFVDDITIDGIEIIDWKDRGIYVAYSKGLAIKNCTISSAEVGDANDGWLQGDGILVYNDGAGHVNSSGSGLTIQDNVFEGEFMGEIYEDFLNLAYKCILVQGCSDVTITGNTMDPGAYTGGIGVLWNSTTEETCEAVTIDDNVINSSYAAMYFVGWSGTNSICNNIIKESDFWSMGIHDFSGTTLIGWNDMSGGTGCGINLNRADNVALVFNLIYDKDFFEGGVTDLYNGIDISRYSDDGLLYHNTIYDIYHGCITLEAYDNEPCTGWTMMNNVLDASANDLHGGNATAFYYEWYESGDMDLNSDCNIFFPYPEKEGIRVRVSTKFDYVILAEWRILQGTTYSQTYYDVHSFDTDPMYLSRVKDAEDFRVEGTSPGRNSGADLSAYFDGTPAYVDLNDTVVPGGSGPDMGAYEFHEVINILMEHYRRRRVW